MQCPSALVTTNRYERGNPSLSIFTMPQELHVALISVENGGDLKYLHGESTRNESVCHVHTSMKSFTTNVKALEWATGSTPTISIFPVHLMFHTTCEQIQLDHLHTSRPQYLHKSKGSRLPSEWMQCSFHPQFAWGFCAKAWPTYPDITNRTKQGALTTVGPSLWFSMMNICHQ